MSILAPEPTLYPDNLLDEMVELRGLPDQRRWWAIYTKSRQEKSLARQLRGMTIPHYLPLVPKVSRIGGRNVRSHLPLFSGYVFLFGSEEERVSALTTNRISQILPVADTAQMTKDLRHVRTLIASGAPLTVEARLQPGRRVRIKAGALMGLEGVIVARRGESRLLIAVHYLQQGVSVQIADHMVEPV
jgi:transcriptional antiterminator RfaH